MNFFQQDLYGTFLTTWRLSLVSFIVAALTGFFYRMGLVINLPAGIELANLRHAHSHLMFFNWICVPLMILMAQSVLSDNKQAEMRAFRTCIYTMITLGFISYPLFLMYGYRPVEIGSANIPLAAAVSGIIMLTWYWFAGIYYIQRRKAADNISLYLYDAAILALIVSSFGAWGVTVAQFTAGPGSLLPSAMTSFFLTVFTEGWVVLAILGVLYSMFGDMQSQTGIQQGWFYVPILFGSMLMFPFSISRSMLTGGMLIAAYIGLFLAGAGLALHLKLIRTRWSVLSFTGKSISVIIACKLLFMVAAIMPIGVWPGEHGVRILYLHTLLLGLASVVLMEAFHRGTSRNAVHLFIITTGLILIILAMISGYWPATLIPPGMYYWIAAIAGLPVIPALWMLFKSFRKKKEPVENAGL